MLLELIETKSADPDFKHTLLKHLKSKLQDFEGNEFDLNKISKVKYIALYSVASWSTPSHKHILQFTEKYKSLKKQFGDAFEVVMLSYDKEESKYKLHLSKFKFPWPILKFKQKPNTIDKFHTGYIPSIVVLDKLSNNLSEGKDPIKVLEVILKNQLDKKQ